MTAASPAPTRQPAASPPTATWNVYQALAATVAPTVRSLPRLSGSPNRSSIVETWGMARSSAFNGSSTPRTRPSIAL
jgi:hypothetical protein